MRLHSAAFLVIGLLLLLPACTAFPGGAAFVAGAVQKGEQAADDVLATGEWTVCNAATVGSVRRKYGRSAEDAERYRSFCEGETADIIRPPEPPR